MSPLEMWGGLECTLNRVQDRFINQIVKSGHINRLSDLQLFADLGIKKLRYPCLWEMVAPESLDHMDWSWLDERLGEMKRLGITPIAGFLHHGSGPCYTSLIDPELPQKMAIYARAFAERYPWVEDYTPFNEINTTARFSCLYGHWYPHHKSDESYLKAIFYQCKATHMAMQEIRKINPKARLIQTDDMGKAQSTEELTYQRDFENERRWLAFDLLCGKVTGDHLLYYYFKSSGINLEDLEWFQHNPCTPDIIGINHYHLSNRYLDHRLELYPIWSHGSNGQDQYADIGAVDTGQVEPPTPEHILMETWYRYQLPIAVTEVHTRGNRESQMRWLNELWQNALKAREKGADIKAITVWSLLGTYDWHNLCTECEMFYEPGVFDLRTRDGKPKATALTHLVIDLIKRGCSTSPMILDEGIWNTQRRVLFGANPGSFSKILHHKSRPVLITGATGTLGQAFAKICGARNIAYRLLNRNELDIADINKVRTIFDEIKPWAVINTAGYVKVDDAEDERDRCFRENVVGPVNLAQICAEKGIRFATFSSDLVFNGEIEHGYKESHIKSPLNVYGQSKAECEEKVTSINPDALIIRTSSFFGPWDDFNFVTQTLKNLTRKEQVHAIHDVKVSPTYVPDLANATMDLLIDREKGILHLTNQGAVSWAEFAKIAAMSASRKHQLDYSLIIEKKLSDLNLKARRPRNSVLTSEKWVILPSLDNALNRYFSQLGTVH
jgi:dTDP-4-dehydrorhamnose reductase